MDEHLQKLWLLSQIGPFRFAHSPTKPVQLTAGQARRIAHNGGHGGPTLIRIQRHPRRAIQEVRIGGVKSLGEQSAVSFDLTVGAFVEMLKPSEELFALADIDTTILVTEVVLP